MKIGEHFLSIVPYNHVNLNVILGNNNIAFFNMYYYRIKGKLHLALPSTCSHVANTIIDIAVEMRLYDIM